MKQSKPYTVGHRRRAEQHCLLVFTVSLFNFAVCVYSVAWVEKALQKFAHQKFKMHPQPFADKSEAKTLRSSIKGIASCWLVPLFFFICEHKRYQYKTIIIQGYEVITSFLRVLSLIQILGILLYRTTVRVVLMVHFYLDFYVPCRYVQCS